MDRDIEGLFKEGRITRDGVDALLERGVVALEKIAEDPVIEMETGPPVCPHCETKNPRVRVQETEASGFLGEFVIQAHCMTCNNVFYAMPVQWECVRTIREVEEAVKERQALGGYDNNG